MTAAPRATRLASLDLLRGIVMVLMAIDHVRVYAGLPPGGPSAGIFFTRWVTHFSAPVFVFLAGTAAFLYGRTHADLRRFLLTRGLWLLLLEFTVIRVSWTFNFAFDRYLLAGVIWVIGICMILLALMVRWPPRLVGALGLLIIFGHNLLDGVSTPFGAGFGQALWKVLYLGFWDGPILLEAQGPAFHVLYSVVPWIGVMAAGYGFGTLLLAEAPRRDQLCYRIGLGATLLFLVLRSIDGYGDPAPWRGSDGGPWFLAFLNTSKYPASLDFLLMTLGPSIALLPLLDRARGAVARGVTVIGRVPFFFYLLHLPLIHLLALGTAWALHGRVDPWLFSDFPMGNGSPPEGYAWTLGQLYAVWAVAIALLYLASRWFDGIKSRRTEWWLRYL